MATTRKLTIEHDGTTYTAELATIKSTHLGAEDHGVFTAMVNCEWDGGGVNVGGYGLFSEKTGYGIDFIQQVIKTVGVSKWEDLVGKAVIVLFSGMMAVGLAHAIKDRVFLLREHSEEWRARSEAWLRD